MSTPNVCEMMCAIRGQPNRGLRDLSSTMALMSASLGPFGPGVLGHGLDENNRWYLRRTKRLMKRQKRRGADADGDLSDSFWIEEERPQCADQPVAQREVRRSSASTAQYDQLLLKYESRDDRPHATGATASRS